MFRKYGQLIMALSILLGAGTQNLAYAETRSELSKRYDEESIELRKLQKALAEAKEEHGVRTINATSALLVTLIAGCLGVKNYYQSIEAIYADASAGHYMIKQVAWNALFAIAAGKTFEEGTKLVLSNNDVVKIDAAIKGRQAEIRLIQTALKQTN